MVITASEIIVNRPYGTNGQRKIRESHTDSAGNVHSITYIADAAEDFNARLASNSMVIGNQLIADEQQRYIEYVSVGINPFVNIPVFTEINAMRTVVLIHFLSISDPTGLVAAVPLLAILTDPELISLLSIDQTKVDEIRARAIDVTNLSTDIIGYTAPLGGV